MQMLDITIDFKAVEQYPMPAIVSFGIFTQCPGNHFFTPIKLLKDLIIRFLRCALDVFKNPFLQVFSNTFFIQNDCSVPDLDEFFWIIF